MVTKEAFNRETTIPPGDAVTIPPIEQSRCFAIPALATAVNFDPLARRSSNEVENRRCAIANRAKRRPAKPQNA